MRGWQTCPSAQLHRLPTPCYLLDEAQLCRNGEILLGVQQRTGCRILLAQKAFSNFNVYPVLAPYLAGTEASGLYESRLGQGRAAGEKENHVFCAAYRTDEFEELLQYADHIVFNSPSQLAKFGPAAKAAGKSIGLRINPECSTQEGHEIYDPCAPGSRLGTTRAQWDAAVAAHPALPALLDGLHFHTLCEQDADALAVTLAAVEKKVCRPAAQNAVAQFRRGTPYHPPGYRPCHAGKLHPPGAAEKVRRTGVFGAGEAWALNAGYLVTTVLDTLRNGGYQSCHSGYVRSLPHPGCHRDALPPAAAGRRRGTAKSRTPSGWAAPPALPGDIIGDYSFDTPLAEGDKAHFRRYGHLHHLQEQHLQRDAAAAHLGNGRKRHLPGAGEVRLQRFQDAAGTCSGLKYDPYGKSVFSQKTVCIKPAQNARYSNTVSFYHLTKI